MKKIILYLILSFWFYSIGYAGDASVETNAITFRGSPIFTCGFSVIEDAIWNVGAGTGSTASTSSSVLNVWNGIFLPDPNYNLIIAGNFIGLPESITATSETVAASVLVMETHITTNGDSDLDNISLANGTVGQVKIFAVKAVGNAADSVKITPATMVGGTQITFPANPLGLGCTMTYTSTGWVVVGNNGGTIS